MERTVREVFLKLLSWTFLTKSEYRWSWPRNLPGRPRRVVKVQLNSFFNLGIRSEWVVNAMPPATLPQEWSEQEDGWATGH